MDIQLEKKKGLQKKHIPYVAGGVLFVILLGWIIFGEIGRASCRERV